MNETTRKTQLATAPAKAGMRDHTKDKRRGSGQLPSANCTAHYGAGGRIRSQPYGRKRRHCWKRGPLPTGQGGVQGASAALPAQAHSLGTEHGSLFRSSGAPRAQCEPIAPLRAVRSEPKRCNSGI